MHGRPTLDCELPPSSAQSTASGSCPKRLRSPGSCSSRSAPGLDTSSMMAPATSSPSAASSAWASDRLHAAAKVVVPRQHSARRRAGAGMHWHGAAHPQQAQPNPSRSEA